MKQSVFNRSVVSKASLAGEGNHGVHEIGLYKSATEVACADLLEDIESLVRIKRAMS